MRRLLLFRHAKAERSEPGMEDRARRLVERGRADAAMIGAYLATHALVPDRVMTSPSARTQETWKSAASSLRRAPAATIIDALYDATPHTIVEVIKKAEPTAATLLVVGHNPGLQAAALMLIAAGDVNSRERLREKMPTCGLAIIEFALDTWTELHSQSGRLERFVTPKTLTGAN